MNGRTKKFLSYYKPYRGTLALDLLCAVAASAVTLILPMLTRYITKDILEGGLPDAMSLVYRTGLVMLALILLYILCSMYVDYQGHVMGAKIERDMRAELFAHLQKLSFRFYDDNSVGQLMSRLTHDTLSLAELYHHGPEDILINTIRVAGTFAILMSVNARLTLVVFLFVPVMVAYMVFFSGKLHRAMRDAKQKISEVNGRVEESLSGIRVSQSYANEDREVADFSAANDAFLESRKLTYRSEAWFYQGMQLLVNLLSVVTIVVGSIMITQSALDLPDLLIYTLYIANLVGPIQGLVHLTRNYQEGITGFHRFVDMLETEPEIRDCERPVSLDHIRGEVAFEHVTFRYTEHSGHVLRDVSLLVNPRETVAIVGHSGVGKTTLCSLIPRFYEAEEGRVLLDGVDVRELSLKYLREQVAVVMQDSFLFSRSIEENIRYGRPDATADEVQAAAKLANAHDFIAAFPDGYRTEIGQRGVKLSGGQRQRLSIARAFLKNSPILILDEATSALDRESEQAVREAMETLSRNRTTFIIAHRLSTVRNADRIVVLSDRGVAEIGTHDELICRQGIYAQLYLDPSGAI